MSFCRTRASILVMLSAVAVGGSTLTAQSPGLPAQSAAHGTGLFVPVTGVADLGGLFSGALFIEGFTAQGNAIVARGMVTGAPNAPVSGQTLFSSLLCSVDRFRDVSNPALLVQQLNAILSALATPQGPS